MRAWIRWTPDKPKRCPSCERTPCLILIRDRNMDAGGPILWYCVWCGADFFHPDDIEKLNNA